ncbi:hypothetical protein EAH76_10645 [Sphingomonas glacialis]|uniref:Uncharacterized protein n=1 Tax=Sphingomonas glacialis TaxID=658225 RepID=A0A502G187_9SPHN|nr:hypothetical protein EAH76_10645 [Sphingomonas glacialis]
MIGLRAAALQPPLPNAVPVVVAQVVSHATMTLQKQVSNKLYMHRRIAIGLFRQLLQYGNIAKARDFRQVMRTFTARLRGAWRLVRRWIGNDPILQGSPA